jgi:hypothetical protein
VRKGPVQISHGGSPDARLLRLGYLRVPTLCFANKIAALMQSEL